MSLNIKFEENQFNRIFPFFILINREAIVVSCGKTLERLFPNTSNKPFGNNYSIKRPELIGSDFNSMLGLVNQLVIIECQNPSKTVLRGQIEYLDELESLLFIGSPWFGSMEQVVENNLSMNDFAFHDPMIDLLHVLKTQEISNDDLKHLLDVVNEQKEKLKMLAMVASANESGVLFTSADGTVFYTNDAYCSMTGFCADDILNHTVFEHLYWEGSSDGIKNSIKEAYSTGKSFNIELVQRRKDGTNFWARFRGQPVLNSNKEVTHFFMMVEDITIDKERDEQLQILSSIAQDNTHGVVISDAGGKVEWVNKSFVEMTGYSFDELVNTKPGRFLQGKDTDPISINYLKGQIAKGEPFVCELLNYHKSGRPYWVRIQGQALKDSEGKVFKYFAIEEDITKEKETKQKLKEFESRFHLALEKLGDNVWEYDFRTGHTEFSSPKNNFLEIDFDDLNLNNGLWWDHVHPEDKYILEENDQKCRNGELDYHMLEYRMVLNDGRIRWVLDRGVVIEKNTDGKPLRMIGTHTDITNQKMAQEAIRRKEQKYRNIIENINLGLLEVDNDEIIQFANQSFCDISGYSYDDLLGKKASRLLAREESFEILKEKNRLRQVGVSDAYEVSVLNKNGEERWWLISGAPNYNDKEELIGSIGIHLDITEKKKLELELIEAKNNAEASTKAKETFLANMSHEIRTPMNAIIGMGNQLKKTSLNTDQGFYLNTIQTAADNLLIIINDILDFSKIEAGKLVLENIGFEPAKIVAEVMQVMRYKAQEKGIQLTNSNCDSTLSPVLIGDPYRITQVLLNLVSNAIKFTDKGSVDITCEVLEDNDDNQIVKTTVKDTGIGMDDEFVKKMFDKFTQETASGTRKYGGTGLGMSISRDLIELMGGQISVESNKGSGSVFSFILNLPKGQKSDLADNEQIEITNNFLVGKKIIVTDDNDHNRLVASIILQNYGAEIIEATNGEEALFAEENNEVDLILMDIQMPILNGYDATRKYREKGGKIPIIALTANAIKGESEKCFAVGMDDYISKPFKEENFLRTIAKWVCDENNDVNISFEKESESMSEVGMADKQVEVIEPLYNLELMNSYSQGNVSFVRKIVKLFCEQSPEIVDQMIQAYHADNYPEMAALAHKVKANFANFDIDSLTNVILDIEKAGKKEIELPNLEELLHFTKQKVDQVVQQMQEDLDTKKVDEIVKSLT